MESEIILLLVVGFLAGLMDAAVEERLQRLGLYSGEAGAPPVLECNDVWSSCLVGIWNGN